MPKRKGVDLTRVKRAMTRLDEIARDHPELLGQSTQEQWEETLKDALASLDVLTINQAAAVLNCHPDTIRKAIRTGKLKAGKVGRDYRISKRDLEIYWQAEGGEELFQNLQASILNVIQDENRKEFEQICRDQGEDPEKVIKHFMADYVQKAREAKETAGKEGQQEADPKMQEILKMRKDQAIVNL